MKCARCFKRLKKAYYHNGQIYGPECVARAGGIVHKHHLVKIKNAEEDPSQGELFK